MAPKLSGFKAKFRNLRNSRRTKNFLAFLVFVFISAVFWLILTMNDEAQRGFDCELKIIDVPDSVTFITPIPDKIRVVIKDKGIQLFRYKFLRDKELTIRFNEFAEGNSLHISKGSLSATIKSKFGKQATIVSFAPDAINLTFTRRPGRKVPVEVVYDVTAAPGMMVSENKQISDKTVMIYSVGSTDSIRRVFTDKIILHNLDKTITVDARLHSPEGTRVIPGSVKVTFNVEQLVLKESEVPVTVDQLPAGRDILFFPSMVWVSYYVPMSRYNEEASGIKVVASFNEAVASSTNKVGVRIEESAPYMSNVELRTDSVEYSLVSGK